tara:strand:- start:206 stop:682 length:477 start_codon:yes stop_codon:yes gene_type:complete
MRKFTIFFLILFSIILTGCGYKVLNKSELINFKIQNIETFGDNRINYLIKNNLNNTFSKGTAEDFVILKITSKKNKVIKEKNIKNQITKYQINLDCNVEVNFVNKNIIKKFNLSLNGGFDVSSSHATTINNQTNLENYLANKISDRIISKLLLNFNDI